MKRSKGTTSSATAAKGNRKNSAGDRSESPVPKKKYNFSKRRAKFKRERDRSSSPEDDVVERHVRQAYVPPSPDAADRRMLRRCKDKPTCLLFGAHREMLYPDHFFAAIARSMKIAYYLVHFIVIPSGTQASFDALHSTPTTYSLHI